MDVQVIDALCAVFAVVDDLQRKNLNKYYHEGTRERLAHQSKAARSQSLLLGNLLRHEEEMAWERRRIY